MPKPNQFTFFPNQSLAIAKIKDSPKLYNMMAVQPDLFKVITEVAATSGKRGKPRAQIKVPISPSTKVNDSQYYEQANKPAQRYYLPRYKIAIENVSGQPRYRMRLAEQNGQWRLSITLTKSAAPELGNVPVDVHELPHSISASISWKIRNTGGAKRELAFTERLTNPDGTITLAAILGSLPERDTVYTALTEQASLAQLVIKRMVEVAVPLKKTGVTSRNVMGNMTAKFNPNLSEVLLARPNQVNMIKKGRQQRVKPSARPSNKPIRQPQIFINPNIFIPHFFPTLATPELEITGLEPFDNKGVAWARYKLRVKNWKSFQDVLFKAAPDLPPCGKNKKASRTWVDIFDNHNKRLYGFCTLSKASDLQQLWVAGKMADPPSGLYIQLVDRRAKVSARSNTVIPPTVTLYQTSRRTVAHKEDLFFNPELHGYIFQDFTWEPSDGQELILRQINFKGHGHSYFQDASLPHIFYCLPNAFKLARSPEGERSPILRLEMTSTESDIYRLTYLALPYFDWDRIVAAESALQKFLPTDHSQPPALMPLQTSEVSFLPANPTLYKSGDIETINLNTIRGVATFGEDDFSRIWDELNGAITLSLSGKVTVSVKGFSNQEIPLRLKMDDTVGNLMAINAIVDPAKGGYQLTLRNAIESPLQIHNLSPFIESLTEGVADIRPANWRELTLPDKPLLPGEEFQALLIPPNDIEEDKFAPLVDTDQVRVLPDISALYDAMLTGSVREYKRQVIVRVPTHTFDHPKGEIAAIQVTFIGGETVILTPPDDPGVEDFVSATAQVSYPLKDVLIGEEVGEWYEYNVVIAWGKGSKKDNIVTPPSNPVSGHAEELLLNIPQELFG